MIDPAFLAEVKRRTSLAELIGPSIARWREVKKGEFRGLCPFHSERTPSFYVVEDKGFFHCFGCGAKGDAVAWVRLTTNAADFREAVDYLAARAGMGVGKPGPTLQPKVPVPQPQAELRAADAGRKINLARAIWRAAGPALDTSPVASYLRHERRIRLPIPPTLRFHPQANHPFWRSDNGFPAMVAAVQGVDPRSPTPGDGYHHDDDARAIVGIHCTYLTLAGAKMPPPAGWQAARGDDPWKAKIMRGVCRGGAVRLTSCEEVMVIAEGIETALSVLQALQDEEVGCPHIDGEPVGVWAALSQSNLGTVRLPRMVREVILAADGDGKIPPADEPGRLDPEAILDLAAAQHRDRGRNVRIARSPAGVDFNDLVAAGAGADADGAAGYLGEAA